jgi:hypothetical protein
MIDNQTEELSYYLIYIRSNQIGIDNNKSAHLYLWFRLPKKKRLIRVREIYISYEAAVMLYNIIYNHVYRDLFNSLQLKNQNKKKR